MPIISPVRMSPINQEGQGGIGEPAVLANDDTAFRLSALTESGELFEGHLRSLLRHSSLRTIQWINLGGHHVQFVTLVR